MDRRSWPWKKKSSDKTVVEKVESVIVPASAGSQGDKVKQDSYKKPNYVQISVDQYSELTGLEDQVKSYEDQVKTYDEQVKRYEDQQLVYEDQIKSLEDEVKELNEQLSEAHSEMITKENLVKQHAKVAEEAVSGWEKAEAEAATLKNHLESVTLLKLTAEDRATHLDGALKECMRQIRNLKEEHEQTVHDIVLAKTKQFEKMKLEFDAKVANLDQELMRSAAENAAVSRSLHDRSNMLVKLSEEKSQAEAEIEVLKSNVESCEREINSLKYELHIVAKELEIRNEEKNMSVRSAEVANKQHLEGVKKIAKLEAECQRLRGLVRKKLPGPAALAQMKLEVDSLGREYGETRVKRSPVKPSTTVSSPHYSSVSDFSLENVQKYQKENDLLTERLLAMEEETKMLKEALTKRNTELQASRTICAKTVSKLQSLESQLQSNSQLKAVSVASVSEEANDDDVSIAGSCATAIVSENTNRLELMDDFLEMEKLANSSNDSDPLENLKSKISDLLNSLPKDSETDKLYEEINRVVQDSVGGKYEELDAAISCIYNFMLVLRKEAKSVTGTSLEENGMFQKLEEFNETESRKMNMSDFILCVAGILGKASELRFSFVGYETNDAEEASSPDCIDKVALPENKVDYSNSCNQFSDTTSDPETPHGGNSVPTSELNVSLLKCSLEEFEQMKLEKENMSVELSKSNENLETIKSQLSETERQLSEVKSQLTAAQKLNCLSETQLKCMAESYNSLEVRSAGLQSRVNLLESKIVMLDNELEEERTKCKDTEAKCKDLQEQLQRIETPLVADVDAKNNQERELAAAAEKLAECQETIYLLGKQLNGLRPQTESMESSLSQKGQTLAEEEEEENEEEEELTISNIMNIHSGNESPIHLDSHEFSPSDSEANNLSKSPVRGKHRPTKSVSSSSSSSNPTPEKNTRGFSRFFSTKPK
ncbi:putative filament-like plant protein [Helianthus anomalus]